MFRKLAIAAIVIGIIIASCNQAATTAEEQVVKTIKTASSSLATLGLEKLSEYNFFTGDLADLQPAEGVLPYDLNTPLFSDYAHKARFVKLPDGTAAVYNDKDVFDFPVGTVLIKNFYYPDDFRKPEGKRRIIETRLLVNKETEGWVALPYVWNDEQTDATLEITGGNKQISWIHYDGSKKELDYSIPNMNQCKGCHVSNNTMIPIGPKARNLNGTFAYADGAANQLKKWISLGLLRGLNDVSTAPAVPVFDDPKSGTLTERARAYLDINCAHCHKADGPGNTSGLMLDYHEQNPSKLGVKKVPIAAGRGSGGFAWDINPGHAESSILWFRMNSDDPGIMMPELGRKLIHTEGVALIGEWIASLPAQESN